MSNQSSDQSYSSLYPSLPSLSTPIKSNTSHISHSVASSSHQPSSSCFSKNSSISFFGKRRKQASKGEGYLIDFLEINQVYYPEDVLVSGVIKEYGGLYGLAAVKVAQTGKEVLCVTLLKPELQQHDNELLKKIENEYEVFAFLDLQGKSLDNLWIDSLPDDSRI